MKTLPLKILQKPRQKIAVGLACICGLVCNIQMITGVL